MIVKSEILVNTSRSHTLEKGDTCSYTDRQITNILFQQWSSENYKFGFRIVDFLILFLINHTIMSGIHMFIT